MLYRETFPSPSPFTFGFLLQRAPADFFPPGLVNNVSPLGSPVE